MTNKKAQERLCWTCCKRPVYNMSISGQCGTCLQRTRREREKAHAFMEAMYARIAHDYAPVAPPQDDTLA